MNYVDRTLLRLADPNTRAAVFDTGSLEQLINAAYDTSGLNLQGPFNPLFDQFRIGLASPRLGTIEGTWSVVGGTERKEARFQAAGVGTGSVIRVDAFWRGAIVARTSAAPARIETVEIQWPGHSGIDEEIVAALGALPGNPVALELERRTRLVQRIRAAFNQPAAFPEASFDDWLRSVGATSAGDLITRFQGASQPGVMQLRLVQGPTPPSSPKPLPVAVSLLIRDAGFSLADLILETRLVHEQLEPMGLGRPSPTGSALKAPLLVTWVVPDTVFNDGDWPGANAAARRAGAGEWLARERIGLVVTS